MTERVDEPVEAEADRVSNAPAMLFSRRAFTVTIVVLVMLATGALTAAIFAIVAVGGQTSTIKHQVDRIDELTDDLAQLVDEATSSRRASAATTCIEIEKVKADARAVLRQANIDPATLAKRSGRTPFAKRNCAAYVASIQPQEPKP